MRHGAVLLFLVLVLAGHIPATAATVSGAELPPPFAGLRFGMTVRAASDALPEAGELDPGVDFGRLKGRLVIPQADAFGSVFRIYLQFDQTESLRQILLERRHAAATTRSAGDIQDHLIAHLGQPDEMCLPSRATPAAARITWRRDGWVLHLIGFDDLGLGIITEDADRGDPLEIKLLGRSRDERFRSRQQRSLPRRILIRIHDANTPTLEPPACGKR